MVVIYRSEKKKIVRNQYNLIQYVKQVLTGAQKALQISDQAYRQLILLETDFERELKHKLTQIPEEIERQKKTKEFEEAYWYRRLVNADYFRRIKQLVKDEL